MADPIIRISLSKQSTDFRHRVLELGVPALDADETYAQVVFQMLGRFAAQPHWCGEFVEYYVQDESGVPLDVTHVRPATQARLEGVLADAMNELRAKLNRFRPDSATEVLVHHFLREELKKHTGADCQGPDIYFLEYSESRKGPPRLVWCWGYQRTDDKPTSAKLCPRSNCRRLYLEPDGYRRKCPQCFPEAPLRKVTGARHLGAMTAAFALMAILMAVWFAIPHAAIVGQVRDAADGAPIVGAQVRINDGMRVLVTDAEGRYRADWLYGGSAAIEVNADGYPSVQLSETLPLRGTVELPITLEGDANVMGRISSAVTGAPVPGATVSVPSASREVVTGEDGRFSLERIRHGHAVVSVRAPGYADAVASRKFSAGQNKEVDILLSSGAILTGRVLNVLDDSPVQGANIGIEGTLLSATSDETGHFTLPAPCSGNADVTVSAAGFHSARQTVHLGFGIPTKMNAPLGGDAVVTGTVIDANTRQPVTAAQVRIGGTSLVATADENGMFRIEGACSGAATVNVIAPGYSPLRRQVVLTAEESPIDAVLIGDGLIVGTVMDGEGKYPVSGTRIAITGTPLRVTSNEVGHFELRGVRSGVSTITASAPGYPERSIEQEILSGAATSLDILLQGDTTILGRVTNVLTNQPVPKAKITIPTGNRSVVTDGEGRFRVDRFPGGPVVFNVSADGYGTRTISQQLVDGDENEFVIALGGNARLQGKVINAATNDPIAGASVQLGDPPLRATTDANGQFCFEGAFPGRSTIKIEASGFTSHQDDKTLTAGELTLLGEVGLRGPGTVVGHIVNNGDNLPVEGAKVTIAGTGYAASTDADGRFQLNQVRSGPAELLLSAVGYGSREIMADVSSVDDATDLGTQRLVSRRVLSGVVINAIDVRPVPDAMLTIEGTGLKATSDKSGHYQFDEVPNRPIKLNVVAKGFYEDALEVDRHAAVIRPVLSPKLNSGEMRIVLTWGPSPPDLDAHLYGPLPEGGRFHIFHEQRNVANVKLDVDNRTGHGPETITITNAVEGVYEFKVHAYQDRKDRQEVAHTRALGMSGATVKVYSSGARFPDEFVVDPKVIGTVWNVFSLSVRKGQQPKIEAVDRERRYASGSPP